MCLPGEHKDAISSALRIQIEHKKRLTSSMKDPVLKELIRTPFGLVLIYEEEIKKLERIKKEIDELDYC
jgi:hypothetical protein